MSGFSNQNFEKKCPLSAWERSDTLERVHLKRDNWSLEGTKFAVRLERVDCIFLVTPSALTLSHTCTVVRLSCCYAFLAILPLPLPTCSHYYLLSIPERQVQEDIARCKDCLARHDVKKLSQASLRLLGRARRLIVVIKKEMGITADPRYKGQLQSASGQLVSGERIRSVTLMSGQVRAGHVRPYSQSVSQSAHKALTLSHNIQILSYSSGSTEPFHSQVQKVHSPNHSKRKCISESLIHMWVLGLALRTPCAIDFFKLFLKRSYIRK